MLVNSGKPVANVTAADKQAIAKDYHKTSAIAFMTAT